MRAFYLLVVFLTVAACSTLSASAPEPVSARDVIAKLNEAGLGLEQVQPGTREEGTPLPNSYREYLTFVLPEVAPRGGQIFVCDTKRNCDALYSYFDAFKALAGPYYYQSESGLVVIQLNSGLSPETAAKFEPVLAGF